MAKYIVLLVTLAFASVHGNSINRSGWGSGSGPVQNVTIDVAAELIAIGGGLAQENHAENLTVTGGWGVPADLVAVAAGESSLNQAGDIIQVTYVDDTSANALNAASVGQAVEADEELAVIASGEDIGVSQIGAASAGPPPNVPAGAQGALAVAAETVILVNQ